MSAGRAALALGAFGAPSLVLQTELFWVTIGCALQNGAEHARGATAPYQGSRQGLRGSSGRSRRSTTLSAAFHSLDIRPRKPRSSLRMRCAQ